MKWGMNSFEKDEVIVIYLRCGKETYLIFFLLGVSQVEQSHLGWIIAGVAKFSRSWSSRNHQLLPVYATSKNPIKESLFLPFLEWLQKQKLVAEFQGDSINSPELIINQCTSLQSRDQVPPDLETELTPTFLLESGENWFFHPDWKSM